MLVFQLVVEHFAEFAGRPVVDGLARRRTDVIARVDALQSGLYVTQRLVGRRRSTYQLVVVVLDPLKLQQFPRRRLVEQRPEPENDKQNLRTHFSSIVTVARIEISTSAIAKSLRDSRTNLPSPASLTQT